MIECAQAHLIAVAPGSTVIDVLIVLAIRSRGTRGVLTGIFDSIVFEIRIGLWLISWPHSPLEETAGRHLPFHCRHLLLKPIKSVSLGPPMVKLPS